jgi:phosphoglycerate dehydrogenase-like enzyme
MKKLKGLYALGAEFFAQIYTHRERRDLEKWVDVYAPLQEESSLRLHPEILRSCEVLLSGWGGPVMDDHLLDEAPNLKLILFAGGSAKAQVTQSMWDRGIQLSSAYAANAQPVVEYALATILFSLKHGWRYAQQIQKKRSYPAKWKVPGAYGTTVGLVSMGMIARMLCEKLRLFDLKILAYDPFLSQAEADRLGVELVSLEELFAMSDVVSLHSPELSETIGMITGRLISKMKEGATLLNTARGSLVREDELIEVVSRRPDLQVILDVTNPEPPVEDSPLYTLPNVILTPHIAGSMDGELARMGRAMVQELERFVAGKPLKWEITPELARMSSHRPLFMDTAELPALRVACA